MLKGPRSVMPCRSRQACSGQASSAELSGGLALRFPARLLAAALAMTMLRPPGMNARGEWSASRAAAEAATAAVLAGAAVAGAVAGIEGAGSVGREAAGDEREREDGAKLAMGPGRCPAAATLQV